MEYSEEEVALHVISKNMNEIVYVKDEGIFYLYNGKYWQDEIQSEYNVEYLIKNAIHHIYGDLNGLSSPISGIIKLMKKAHPEITILKKQFNSQKHLLCCENCVVNLDTGEYLPHSPEYFHTYSTKITIEKPEINDEGKIKIPDRFDKFISNLVFRQNDDFTEKRKYMLLKLLAHYIHGKPGKRSFLHIYGSPGTGKSKLGELIGILLGEYATSISFTTLAVQGFQNGSSPSPDLVEPMGKRIAITDEPSTKKEVSSAMVKAITGGSIIKGRNLYSNLIRSEAATYTPVIISNGLLKFDEPDAAIMERITMIKTINPVPKLLRDEYLIENLKHEAGKILGVLVLLGSINKDHGLQKKLHENIVNVSHDIFRIDKQDFLLLNMDSVDLFVTDKINFNPSSMILSDKLYDAYMSYCSERKIYSTLPKNSFISTLKEKHGLYGCRKNNQRGISGINLNDNIKGENKWK